jgi:hypothetical protein
MKWLSLALVLLTPLTPTEAQDSTKQAMPSVGRTRDSLALRTVTPSIQVFGAQGPLADVEITDLVAETRAKTDSNGVVRFHILALHDTIALSARKLGYAEVRGLYVASVEIITIDLTRTITLPEVNTVATYRLDIDAGRWEGFHSRCSVPHVQCFSSVNLAAHPARSISEVLAHAPDGGVKRTCYGSGARATCTVSIDNCPPAYFLDGVPFSVFRGNPLDELEKFVGPLGLKGVEVYRPELTPLRFRTAENAQCSAAVVLWTK